MYSITITRKTFYRMKISRNLAGSQSNKTLMPDVNLRHPEYPGSKAPGRPFILDIQIQ